MNGTFWGHRGMKKKLDEIMLTVSPSTKFLKSNPGIELGIFFVSLVQCDLPWKNKKGGACFQMVENISGSEDALSGMNKYHEKVGANRWPVQVIRRTLLGSTE